MTITLLATVHLLGRLALSSAAPPHCDTPEFRQFDFWVGQWDVTARGKTAGTNLVTLEEDGCLVHEHWTGAGGSTGQSLNFFDQADRRWHQVWVSNSGNILMLSGTLTRGILVLEGERTDSSGHAERHRISFTPSPDGTVRQLWENSDDGGATWSIAFDGLYRRRKA
jgi:hypothetical protein